MIKMLPLLTDPGSHGSDPADSFDVIVPSLPGFGFSDRPSVRGMTREKTADLWALDDGNAWLLPLCRRRRRYRCWRTLNDSLAST
jgi:pimeloyl-ACP methyl ester carboxylesterase